MEEGTLSHLDELGRAQMVDVTEKAETVRQAVAKGFVSMKPETVELLKRGEIAKGDVLTVAKVAGIAAAKRTSELIPMCHPILVTAVDIQFQMDEERSGIHITSTATATGKTGVEMEALVATAVSALTIYDMCKSADRSMRIGDIRLVRKSGGKSGTIVLE